MYYSSSRCDRNYDIHRYLTYLWSNKGYFPDDFKRENPPNFDGYLKKSEDAEAWIIRMKKFFEFNEYTESMKAKNFIFILKGKAAIWWEDMKWVKDM